MPKSIKSFATSSRTSTVLEIDASNDAKEEIGEFLIEQIKAKVSTQTSPVYGDKFPALSTEYRKFKEESGRSGVPDLDFEGDMLSSLDYRVRKDGLEIGVFDDDAPKADGHNNFSGKSKLPLRRFLPDEGESFMPEIDNEIEQILAERIVEDVSPSELEDELQDVETRADFFAALRSLFAIEDEDSLKRAIIATPALFERVKSLGLQRYLKL